jgi:hypothetical protein
LLTCVSVATTCSSSSSSRGSNTRGASAYRGKACTRARQTTKHMPAALCSASCLHNCYRLYACRHQQRTASQRPAFQQSDPASHTLHSA